MIQKVIVLAERERKERIEKETKGKNENRSGSDVG